MRVALIPPVKHLEYTHLTDIQLMLPQLLNNAHYRAKMEYHLSNPNQYVILDNGAAEGESPTFEELVAIVEDFYPQEVAIPDTLGNWQTTLSQAERFIARYGDLFCDIPTKLGFVAQGTNMVQAMLGVHNLMQSHEDMVDVIYLPRLLIGESSDPFIRLKLAEAIHVVYPRQEIHLFGAHINFMTEVNFAHWYPFIRSIDTSLPFVMATYEETIRQEVGKSRKAGYFETEFTPFQADIVMDNVHTYLRWAGL